MLHPPVRGDHRELAVAGFQPAVLPVPSRGDPEPRVHALAEVPSAVALREFGEDIFIPHGAEFVLVGFDEPWVAFRAVQGVQRLPPDVLGVFPPHVLGALALFLQLLVNLRLHVVGVVG